MEYQNLFNSTKLKDSYDYLAPDKSEIRLLQKSDLGEICHCTMPTDKTSTAVYHKTVFEIWYVLSGEGEMWQKKGESEETVRLDTGVAVTIPVGNSFQFRNTGSVPLCILITTMPKWPGPDEAVVTEGKWDVSS